MEIANQTFLTSIKKIYIYLIYSIERIPLFHSYLPQYMCDQREPATPYVCLAECTPTPKKASSLKVISNHEKSQNHPQG